MSRLYGTLIGDRGKQLTKPSTRCLEAHLATWDSGIRIEFSDNKIVIHKTGGSSDSFNKELIYEED